MVVWLVLGWLEWAPAIALSTWWQEEAISGHVTVNHDGRVKNNTQL